MERLDNWKRSIGNPVLTLGNGTTITPNSLVVAWSQQKKKCFAIPMPTKLDDFVHGRSAVCAAVHRCRRGTTRSEGHCALGNVVINKQSIGTTSHLGNEIEFRLHQEQYLLGDEGVAFCWN